VDRHGGTRKMARDLEYLIANEKSGKQSYGGSHRNRVVPQIRSLGVYEGSSRLARLKAS
jgi:hypothetical protein